MQLRTNRLRQPRQGATIVEAAVIMVLFLTFLFSIIEYGRYLGLKQTAENGARHAARWAVINTSYNSINGLPNGDLTMIRQRARAMWGGGPGNIVENQLHNPQITAFRVHPVTGANLGAWDTAGYGESIAVQITGQFRWNVPNFLQLASGVMQVRTRVVMRVE